MVLKAPEPEFSRPLDVGRVSAGGSTEKITASADECVRLAKRLDLPAIHELKAKLLAKPWRGGGLKLTGELTADVEQISVISLETFRQEVTFPIERYFLSGQPKSEDGAAEEIDAIVAGHVDLGEVVAETLALELDPYPRKPGEAFAATGDDAEKPEGGALSRLRALKPGKDGRK
jgi:hypothetical protein